VWLGAVDGLAPMGGWIAVSGRLPWEAWALGGAVALWVAGFDLFYSLFDREIDLDQGLHSIATRFGVAGAFRVARLFHAGTVVLLVACGLGLGLGGWYWLGVAAVAALLAYEHLLVRPTDLGRLDAAFFTVNGVIAVVLLVFVVLEVAT
jgi:4-hydroxybenzoate polyprenyltransferase